MGVSSIRVTEYTITCDSCGVMEVCHSTYESVYSKQQAIKWAGMHRVKNGDILCNTCFNHRKIEMKKQ